MRIIRDGICYIDLESLVRRSITKYMDYDKEDYSLEDFVTISNPRGFKAVANREDILDYDEVKDLSKEELDEKVKRVEADMEPFINKWNHTPFYEREKLYKEKEYTESYEKLKDYYFELVDYRANREEIDDRINKFLNSKTKVKRL